MEEKTLKISCSRGLHLYTCGEGAYFKIEGNGPLHIELSRDGAELLQQWEMRS